MEDPRLTIPTHTTANKNRNGAIERETTGHKPTAAESFPQANRECANQIDPHNFSVFDRGGLRRCRP